MRRFLILLAVLLLAAVNAADAATPEVDSTRKRPKQVRASRMAGPHGPRAPWRIRTPSGDTSDRREAQRR